MRYGIEGCLKNKYCIGDKEVYVLINKIETYMYSNYDFNSFVKNNIDDYALYSKDIVLRLSECMNKRMHVADISRYLGLDYQRVFIMRHSILEDIIGSMTKEELFEIIDNNKDYFLG